MKKLFGILRNFFAIIGFLVVCACGCGLVVVASWTGWHL